MKILITGAGGFLGRNLIEKLLYTTKYSLVALTSKKQKLIDKWRKFENRIQVFSNFELNDIAWDTVDIMVNCAFPRNDDGKKMAAGLKFINDLYIKSSSGGVGAVVNISSQSVYSQKRQHPANEGTELNLESKYAVGKYATELMTDSIFRDFPHTNLRLASLIGPGFEQRITNKFVKQALLGQDLQIVGGNQIYGFFDIRDAVDGLIAVCKSDPNSWAEVYNFGSNDSYTLEEIAKCVCELSEKYCTSPVIYHMETALLTHNSSLDCNLFSNDFKWKSQYKLKGTLNYIFKGEING